MKPTPCQTQRDLMVEHALGELQGLKKTRLESHLDHCASCQKAYERISTGLAEARAWQPVPPEVDVDRMVSRLSPLMSEDPAPARFQWDFGFPSVVLGAAAAAALIAVFVLRPDPSPVVEPLVSSPSVAVVSEVPALPDRPIIRTRPNKHLRLVASPDWDGAVESVGEKTDIEMSSGYAVLDFEGGKGRALSVVTPNLRVDVLGTRFVVDRQPDVTLIAVLSGKVAVTQGGRREVLPAGTVRGFSGADSFQVPKERLRSRSHHEDTFLEREAAPPPSTATPKEATRSPDAVPKPRIRSMTERPSSWVTAFTRAEHLVRDGQTEEALEVYHRLIASEDPAVEPFRDLARYERARIWGFVQKDLQKAAEELDRLARYGQGEVRRQAAFARCECDLHRDRCAAKKCLESLANHPEFQAKRESQILLRTWKLELNVCGDHKNEDTEQLRP